MTTPSSPLSRRSAIAALSGLAFVPRARTAAQPRDDIVFGMSAPLSGDAGAYGRALKEGADAAFERANGGGGFQGRALRLVALDDGYEVDAAVANTRKFIGDSSIFGLMNYYGTASTTAVLPLLAQSGLPLVGTVSGAMSLRHPFNRYIFHLRASYDDETAAIVNQLMTVGLRRIAVFYQADGFGEAGLTGAQGALARHGLQAVAVASVPRNSVAVEQAVKTIAAAKPDAVIMATLYRPTAQFVRQMRAAGRQPQFVALSPVGTDQLITELGPEQSRGVQVSQVIPFPWGSKLQIVREYKADMSRRAPGLPLSYYGLEGYLTARLVSEALLRVDNRLGRESFMAALRSRPFDLGGFAVSLSPGNNAGSRYVEISIVGRDGLVLR